MVSLTRSSSPSPNHAARGSVLLALLGLALPIVAFFAARQTDQVTLLQATGAACGAVGLGLLAILLAQAGPEEYRTLDRPHGRRGDPHGSGGCSASWRCASA